MSFPARLAAVLFLGAAAGAACGRRPASSGAPSEKVAELRAILASRNDNDPRLDRDFAALTPDEKEALRREYASLPRERFNERGTIVYLLGRNLASPEDWRFLGEVASEPPCLSLADCSRPSGEPAAQGDAVTLAYPALVALKSAERAAALGADAEQARQVFFNGSLSEARPVQLLAARLLREAPKR